MQVLATSAGGVGTHVHDLCRGLIAGGATVTVGGPEETQQRFGFAATGAQFSPVEISASSGPADAAAVRQLRQLLQQVEPDLVHAHGLRAGLVAALALRRRAVRRPLVVTLHNAVISRGLRGRAGRWAERVIARSADMVLGASTDLVERAVRLGATRAQLAPVAAPELPAPRRTRSAVRAELGLSESVPALLSVGRLHPQKGYDVLVAAASRWRELVPAPHVFIAGDGPSYLDLTTRISTTRAPVTLLGHRGDVAELLTAADVAVVSSVWEARQLFAQEAMRAGVPLVATEVGGLPELVGEAAVLVPPQDVDALDAAVRRLLADPSLREHYAQAGRARAATWPTSVDMLAQLRGVYAELTGIPVGA